MQRYPSRTFGNAPRSKKKKKKNKENNKTIKPRKAGKQQQRPQQFRVSESCNSASLKPEVPRLHLAFGGAYSSLPARLNWSPSLKAALFRKAGILKKRTHDTYEQHIYVKNPLCLVIIWHCPLMIILSIQYRCKRRALN